MSSFRGHVAVVALVAVVVVGPVAPLVAGAGAAATVQQEPNFQVFVPEPTLQAGQPNELTVQVVNDADDAGENVAPASSVEVSLSGDGTPLSVQSGTARLGTLPQDTPADVPFRVDVPADAPSEEYQLSMEISYVHDGERRTEFATVEVRVDERPRFEVEVTDVDVDVGDTGTVDVRVENVGDETASDATVQLQSANSDVSVGGAAAGSRFAGTLDPGETRTLEFSVGVAPEGDQQSYALQATVEYVDELGQAGQSRPLSVGFTPGPEQSFAVEDVESTLRVGEEGTLRGTVTNEGDRQVTDAVVVLRTESETVSPRETEYAVDSLAANESAEFAFDIDVAEGAQAGPKRFTFVVEYRTADDDERRESDEFDVQAEVAPSTDVFAVEGISTTVDAGGEATLRLEVTNQRNETLSDVSAKLFATDPLSSDDDEAFVGTLDPGESSVVVFSMSAASGALDKQYPVEVDFQYQTADGDTELSDTYKVAVDVEGGGDSDLPRPLLIGGVAVLVVLGAAALFARGRL